VRVTSLADRFLKIYDEYKDNILLEFHLLETNGKQLRNNNALIDNRINFVVLNCDKKHYSLEAEE
jgi:hypothetical protein